MSKKTKNQENKEVEQKQERLRLVGKSHEVLRLLQDETSKDALAILNFLIQGINSNLNEEAAERIIKDVCHHDLAD